MRTGIQFSIDTIGKCVKSAYSAGDDKITPVPLANAIADCWHTDPIPSLILIFDDASLYMIRGDLMNAVLKLIQLVTTPGTNHIHVTKVNTTLTLFIMTPELTTHVKKSVTEWYLI
jgi:hypothetical protein